MPGEIVHIEIPADDTAQAREFWGSLFGWTFENFPGPSEYHMARLSDPKLNYESTWASLSFAVH